jgi:4-amino-4-deoxy-L-arabinose transferase-like glycosyltransferase
MPLDLSHLSSLDARVSRSRWQTLKLGGLVLLCLAWVALGLVGHAPWKGEDARTIVVAWEMVNTRDLLVPSLIGEPYFTYGPLVSQLAALTMKMATPWFAPHDAARLAAGLLLLAMLGCVSLAGHELGRYQKNIEKNGGKTQRWLPMLILIGSVGLFERAHQLSPQLGLMAAIALGLWALALALRRPGFAGVLLGGALTVGAFSYSLAAWFWLLFPALLLPCLHSGWRQKSYLATLGIALVLAAMLCALWPLGLYQRSPELFAQWWAAQSPSVWWSGQRIIEHLGWLGRNLPWMAFPAWPLIAWLVWIRARGFNGGFWTPQVILPTCVAAAGVVALLLLPDVRPIEAMALLVPLALLASIEVETLPRGGSAGLDWFGILTFGLAAIALWFFWWDAYINGLGSYAAELFRDAEVGYQPTFRLRGASISLFLTVLWILLVRPARQSNQRAVLNWAVGMMLIWGLVATMWMPYVDSRRSYEVVAKMLRPYAADGCMASREVGEAQRAIFYYYAQVKTLPEQEAAATTCPLLLVQYGAADLQNTLSLDGFEMLQSGSRYGDDTEMYVLYRKVES